MSRVDELRCIFGLSTGAVAQMDARRDARTGWAARAILERVEPGQVGLITGPSGGGKSSILREVERLADLGGLRVIRTSIGRCRSRRAAIELVGVTVDDALALLGSAGLGDASVAMTSASELSDGESARLSLARAIDASDGSGLVLIDEFCSTLDGVTAHGVARAFSRWVAREAQTGLRAIVATARDEMIDSLSPDLVCWQGIQEDPLLAWRGADGRVRACTEAGATGADNEDQNRARVA